MISLPSAGRNTVKVGGEHGARSSDLAGIEKGAFRDS